jgi:hypothetical protein
MDPEVAGSADPMEPDGAGLADANGEDEPSSGATDPQDEGQADATDSGGEGMADSGAEDTGQADATDSGGDGMANSGTEDTGQADATDGGGDGMANSGTEDTGQADATDGGGEGMADSMEAEEESPTLPSKLGYLVFPDDTEQPIPQSQWLIGRADLAKYVSDPDKASEISRGHMTVFQEGEKFFVEDGKTMVQERPSANKTWLVRGGAKILVTGTGRNELQDADEIDVAELVKLQFVAK